MEQSIEVPGVGILDVKLDSLVYSFGSFNFFIEVAHDETFESHGVSVRRLLV